MKIALACDLVAQNGMPDTKPTIFRLLIGERKENLPTEGLAPVRNELVRIARDLDVSEGEFEFEGDYQIWKLSGAYYYRHINNKVTKDRDSYFVYSDKTDSSKKPTRLNRRSLTYVAEGDDYTIERQCRVVEPNEAHEAVKAEQAKAPENKI